LIGRRRASARVAPAAVAPAAVAPFATITLLFAVSLGAYACSGNVKAVALRPAEAGPPQYRITCAKNISHCRDKAYEVCAGEFEVLQSSGHQVDPERITTAPGPTSTGPNFPAQTWAGELIVECGHHGPHSASSGAETIGAAPAASAAPAPSPAPLPPGYLCLPGSTQVCLGAAACRGAQACLADGQGFGPCDCGPTSPSVTPQAGVTAQDAGAGAAH
jgi:hypothetical protein